MKAPAALEIASQRYSAAFSSGGLPERNCSSSAASSALAAARWRALTWPKPRIFSGIAARPTASGWLSGVSFAEHLVEHRLVVGDQLALGLALLANSRTVERRAAQELQLRQQPERAHHPRPEAHLARLAGRRIAAREQRRREMELEAQVLAAELVARPACRNAPSV